MSKDPISALASSSNPAIAFFAQRDLLGEHAVPVSALWGLREPLRIVRRQNANGAWSYPSGNRSLRSLENYDQIETFRQLGILVERYGFTREHPAIARAAEFLLSFQARDGDIRGIYGNQYATTYAGAITELLIKAGYAADPRIARLFSWLLTIRQSDGGWAIAEGPPVVDLPGRLPKPSPMGTPNPLSPRPAARVSFVPTLPLAAQPRPSLAAASWPSQQRSRCAPSGSRAGSACAPPASRSRRRYSPARRPSKRRANPCKAPRDGIPPTTSQACSEQRRDGHA